MIVVTSGKKEEAGPQKALVGGAVLALLTGAVFWNQKIREEHLAIRDRKQLEERLRKSVEVYEKQILEENLADRVKRLEEALLTAANDIGELRDEIRQLEKQLGAG